MNKLSILFSLLLVAGLNGVWAQCSDLFFSEYIEGSGNNKALEIFNPTNADVNLAGYVVYRYGNGSATATDTFQLSGIISAGDVRVMANDGADPLILAVADDSIGFPGVITFNGDDAMALINENTGDTLDVFGTIGFDPGSFWILDTANNVTSQNVTLVRMPSVTAGTTDWTQSVGEWIALPNNTFDSLDFHNSMCNMAGPGPGGAPCSDLFFSEYIEGSGNNKGIEVFNPTDNPIDLANYRIVEYGNGGSFQDTLDLAPFGMLAAGDVLVLTTDAADPAMLAVSDSAFAFPSITHFNGDDALVLLNLTSGDTLDIFGIVGADPGFWWPVGMGDSTQNITLVRMPSVNQGGTDWAVVSQEWLSFASNTFDSLGAHTMTPCSTPPGGGSNCTTELFFSEYIEGSGNNKGIEVFNPTDNPIDLSDYRIVEYGNGGSFQDTLDLAPFGMLAGGDVLVLTTDAADPAMLAVSDSAFSFPSITHFNGDDALVLLKLSTGDTLDIFGIVGADPGFWWPVGTGDSTQNITLVRMPSVNEGGTDWSIVSQQWLSFASNTFDSLGFHNMNPCSTTPPNPGNQTNCSTELFFSEYIEGTSNNKAIEIFNPLDMSVDLDNYEIHRFNNGTSLASDVFELTGTLGGSEVFVVGNPAGDPAILAESDTLGSATFFSGDDALALINSLTGDTLDIFGVIGEDPGFWWPLTNGDSTQNITLVRMSSVNEGTTDWVLGASQWLGFPANTYDSLGSHTMNPCPEQSGCETDIFFSEYIEGSSNNKALEIFNPADTTVSLDNYTVYRYGNGSSTPTDTLELSGTLAPGAVYIAANDGADSLILVLANDSVGFPGAITFNGDDAVGLWNEGAATLVDVIGEIGVDPGTNWPVGSGSTRDNTLVRMPSVNEGTTDWGIGASQWIVLPSNTFDSLGSHTMNPCPVVVPPTVAFSPTTASVGEDVGTAGFTVIINNPAPGDSVAVDVMFNATASTATLGTDFTWTDTTVVFAAGATSPIALSVDVVDDTDVEGDEQIVVDLMNPTNGAVLGASTLTVTIEDNDFNVYPIGLITDDAVGDGLPDSLGVVCQIQGIVHGVDLQGGSSVQFTIIDSTGGIGLFSGNDFGYTVLEGDEVIIQGEVDDFNGLAQMSPSNIILVSSGNPTVTPLVVTQLDETTENELVVIECVTQLDTIFSTGSGTNINFTNYVDTFAIRFDNDVDQFGAPLPAGKWLNITGLGGQFDGSFPHLDGYQLLPRYMMDLEARPDPTVGFAVAADTAGEDAGTVFVNLLQTDGNPDTTEVTVVFDATNSTATLGTDFSFTDETLEIDGCGTVADSVEVVITDDSDLEGDETVILVITTVTNNASVAIDTVTLTIEDDESDAIGNLLNPALISLYPNPASDRLVVEASLDVKRIAIYNVVGQQVTGINRPDRLQEIHIGHLPKGVYTLRAETAEGVWMQKWVKK